MAGFIALFLLLLGIGGYALWLMHNIGQAEVMTSQRELNRILLVRHVENAVSLQERRALSHLDAKAESGEDLAAWKDEQASLGELQAKLASEAGLSRPGSEHSQGVVELMAQLSTLYSRMAANWGDAAAFQADLPELKRLGRGVSLTANKVVKNAEAQLSAAGKGTEDLRRQSTQLMVAALAIAAGIFAYTAFVIGRAVIQPIRDLTHCIREISSGHLDQKVEISSNDELREMADAFNAMAGELRAHRKKSTDELLRAHQLLQTTLATFPDPIFVLSDPNRIAFQNPAGQRVMTELDLLGELPAAIKRRLDRVFATGQDFFPTTLTEANYFRIRDQAHYYLTRMLAMHRDDGAVSGVIVAMQDVTRLRLMDEIKTNHLATLSHELKTPLTSLQLALELLGEDKANTFTDRQIQIISSARADAERLVERLRDILDLSKFQASSHAVNQGANEKAQEPRRPSLGRRLTTRIVSLRGERE